MLPLISSWLLAKEKCWLEEKNMEKVNCKKEALEGICIPGDPYQMHHDCTSLTVWFRAFIGYQLWNVDLCEHDALEVSML